MNRLLEDWLPTLVAAGGVTVVAVAGAVLTDLSPWYYSLRRPSWQPPDWLFGPAWTVIFICEAASAVIGWRSIHSSFVAALFIALLVLNGALNMLWSYFFFTRQRPDHAQAEVPFLWLSILAPMVVLYMYAGWAWVLLLPYLLWVSFAAFLNHMVVRLNGPFEGKA